MKKGFTLVELSIVLVIIGLLIGGILVAQSMISTVKVQRLVRDIAQYEIAITNFKTNFKYYPGDAPHFIPRGNGDNFIDTTSGGAFDCDVNTPQYSNYESFQVWAHLSQSKMLDKNYETYSPQNGSDYGNCGGPHANYYELSLAGIVWPDFNKVVTKYAPQIFKTSASTNLNLLLYISPQYVIPLESKLGAKNYDFSERQVGLTNYVGVGQCYDDDGMSAYSCTSSSAVYGQMYYYFQPI